MTLSRLHRNLKRPLHGSGPLQCQGLLHHQGSRSRFSWMMCLVSVVAATLSGCTDDRDTVRAIKSQRQERLQTSSLHDHIGEAHKLLENLVELNPKKARRQISYHLNAWSQEQAGKGASVVKGTVPELVKTIDDLLTQDDLSKRFKQISFNSKDTDHLRDAYLFEQVVEWVDHPEFDDTLLKKWFKKLESNLGKDDCSKLKTASRLFDWCVRNIAYERQELSLPIQGVRFSDDSHVVLQGTGYRQTNYQTLYRGTGDAWQLAGVFERLCRQAHVDAFTLAIADSDSGKRTPWSIGVLVGERIYLFEPELGVPIPGPGQVGIATLAEARTDASVMRRLNVAGFFDYPMSKSDIGQSIALLNVVPEAMSARMQRLQNSLTGERRMITYVDVDDLSKRIDAVRGIADVRLSRNPLLAERYAVELEMAADRIPQLQYWYRSRWAILEAPATSAQQLSLGRWRHLQGKFSDNEADGMKGARGLYLTQRAPEFEIAKLRTDVNLQMAYGIRRELGMDPKLYEQLILQAQQVMRMGKQTATYWIGLLQYDDERTETAQSWFTKRVIEDGQTSQWDPSAVYNSARTAEKMKDYSKAMELYKSEKNGRPHGSRIRARLLAKSMNASDS